MIKLVSLELEGFGSFKEKAKVTFPSHGAVLLAGRRTDSACSSGTGKSTIVKGIAFALGYCDIPATELKNWDSKKISVILEISHGDHIYKIIRDPKLSLVLDGVPYTSTSVGAEEKLKEILQIPANLISILTYRPQRSKGTFLNATDSEKKEFLSTLLNITVLEEQGDAYLKQQQATDKVISDKNIRVSSFESILPSLEVSEEKIGAANASYQEALQYRDSIKSYDTNDLEDELRLLSVQRQQISQQQNKAQLLRHQIETVQRDAAKINGEIAKVQVGMCPTCAQTWDKSQHHIDRLKDELRKLFTSYNEMNAELQAIKIEPLGPIDAQIAQVNLNISKQGEPLRQAQINLANAKAMYDELYTRRTKHAEICLDLISAKSSLTELEKESKKFKCLAEILSRNGFLAVIFDEVLAEIEFVTNQMLSEIPNVETFVLKINSHAETKAGKVKKSINVKVMIGIREVSTKNLSGGQLCSLELCLDLAIAEVIRKRLGSPLQWICLDEAMDGLDAETKKPALEMLKSKIGGQILVIDHSTEVKEGFQSIIKVVYDGHTSQLEE